MGYSGRRAAPPAPAQTQSGSSRQAELVICDKTIERTHTWMNAFGKLRRCTEQRQVVVDLSLFLAAALVVLRRLIQEARTRYRWPGRPTVRRLK
jgi:hypothetical protein